MKSLKPSLREKKRYLLVEGGNLKENVESSILDFTGVLGMSKVGLSWIKKGRDFVIISVNREAVDLVRASFCVWKEDISVARVSGTLKGLGKV